jgi:hypothetical protein
MTVCDSIQILLVPTTELLLTSRDRETQVLYSDLVSSEEFLASHVLRVPGAAAAASVQAKGGPGSGTSDFRESRSKPKQFTTLNGRTVIVKDTYVYSNKGRLGHSFTASKMARDGRRMKGLSLERLPVGLE